MLANIPVDPASPLQRSVIRRQIAEEMAAKLNDATVDLNNEISVTTELLRQRYPASLIASLMDDAISIATAEYVLA